MRLSRALFIAVRPKAPRPVTKPPPKKSPSISRTGLAVLLGSLAFGSWLIKPSRTAPSPAMDLFKPHICVVFVLGDAGKVPLDFAKSNKFTCLKASEAPAELPSLIDSGKTKFIITDMNTEDVKKFEDDIVECDALLDYNTEIPANLAYIQRGRRLHNMGKNESIESVLRERNLI